VGLFVQDPLPKAPNKCNTRHRQKERKTGGLPCNSPSDKIIEKALQAYGVPYVAGLPGHDNRSLIDAFNDPVSKLPSIAAVPVMALSSYGGQ
jgi:hypothetical protein